MNTSEKFQNKMNLTVEQHHREIASKLVSLIRELERKLGKEKAHEIVSEWAECNSVNDIKGVMKSLEKAVNDFEDVKLLMRQWVKDLNENNMETVEITTETETDSICIVTDCIYAKVFDDLNASDIGYILYCKHDFAAAPVIHPRVGLRRSKTLMEGHDCCDFDYYWMPE
ncbi:MAG: L-2-amino-thiazoline-4-carboxylic acid hydrolase [Candidatus Thorarchaeota archaeon]